MLSIRQLSASDARLYVQALADVLLDCVAGGASVSFMASLSRVEAERFFDHVIEEVVLGRRFLLAAFAEAELVGTVQVITSMPANQPHRAEIAKLLVKRAARSSGVGRRLMEKAEEVARQAGKTLLVLDTASCHAEQLYVRLGWIRVGSIPNYALLPDGAYCDTTLFYKQLK